MSQPIRICLWSGPRNISTALMYSFAQRADTAVFDEPLYAHYLSKTPAREYHPGAAQVIAEMENDGEKVVQHLILGNRAAPVLFFKHMTHHLNDLDWSFMRQTVNIILTRDPYDMLPSYARQVEQPALHDVGYALHLELLDFLRGIGQEPPVLDSKQTLLNPRGVLRKLCDQIGIPFDEAMLSWQPGARPERWVVGQKIGTMRCTARPDSKLTAVKRSHFRSRYGRCSPNASRITKNCPSWPFRPEKSRGFRELTG